MDSACDGHDAATGADAGKGDARADRANCRKLTDAEIATAPIVEVRRVSRHTAVIGGRTIAYTATAGTLTLRDDDGKPTASMFYVAYTTGEARRPVTFLYNGGPGSSTLWLHMGSLGPVHVETDSPEATHNAPFTIANNPDSLLDKSDLVFLDAVGAGFSRPVGDTKLKAFWGTDEDIDAFARGIERWLTVNERWNAPKFIFGEILRHDAFGWPLLPPAGRRGAAERRGPAVVDPELRRAPAGLRPADGQLPAELRGGGRLPPSTGQSAGGRRRLPAARCASSRAARTPWRWPRAQDLSRRRAPRRRRRRWRATSACRSTTSWPAICASRPAASARSCCATSA